MGNQKEHTLDVEEINRKFTEGRLIALALTSEYNVMYGPTVYTMISSPINNDAGQPTYRLGYIFDNDETKWSSYMNIAEMMNTFYFYKLTDEVYD